ncbi:MAG: hypothetical protein ACYCOU_06105, partial [Sulfobacillus sp.]
DPTSVRVASLSVANNALKVSGPAGLYKKAVVGGGTPYISLAYDSRLGVGSAADVDLPLIPSLPANGPCLHGATGISCVPSEAQAYVNGRWSVSTAKPGASLIPPTPNGFAVHLHLNIPTAGWDAYKFDFNGNQQAFDLPMWLRDWTTERTHDEDNPDNAGKTCGLQSQLRHLLDMAWNNVDLGSALVVVGGK